MTCIVGLKDKGRVYLGGDSLCSYGWEEKRALTSPKVIRWGEFLIGSSGTHRMAQLVEYELKVSRQIAGQTDLEYLVIVLAGEMRKLFKEHGYSEIENNKETSEGEFLVGYHGDLYHIDSRFAVENHTDAFDAIGVGAPYALGALSVLEDVDLSPKKKIKLALQAATRFSNGVDGHYTIIRSK